MVKQLASFLILTVVVCLGSSCARRYAVTANRVEAHLSEKEIGAACGLEFIGELKSILEANDRLFFWKGEGDGSSGYILISTIEGGDFHDGRKLMSIRPYHGGTLGSPVAKGIKPGEEGNPDVHSITLTESILSEFNRVSIDISSIYDSSFLPRQDVRFIIHLEDGCLTGWKRHHIEWGYHTAVAPQSLEEGR